MCIFYASLYVWLGLWRTQQEDPNAAILLVWGFWILIHILCSLSHLGPVTESHNICLLASSPSQPLFQFCYLVRAHYLLCAVLFTSKWWPFRGVNNFTEGEKEGENVGFIWFNRFFILNFTNGDSMCHVINTWEEQKVLIFEQAFALFSTMPMNPNSTFSCC